MAEQPSDTPFRSINPDPSSGPGLAVIRLSNETLADFRPAFKSHEGTTMIEKLENHVEPEGVTAHTSDALPMETGLGSTDHPEGQSMIERESPGLPDFDLGLENFISTACSRPPIEVYRDHPAIQPVAKAIMVAYREKGRVSSDSDPFDFFGDAMRILRNVTSDGDGSLLYEGITSEMIVTDEILEVRRAAMRRRMRDRGMQPRQRNQDFIKHHAELVEPTDDEVFLQVAASLISRQKPGGSAIATAWREIRNTYIAPESALTKEVEWFPTPWFHVPGMPQTDIEKAQEKDGVIKTRALAAFQQCMANTPGWRGVVMSISDALDIELSMQAAQFAKSQTKKTEDKPAATIEPDPKPVDLWGKFTPPDLPRGLLPPLIEEFAFAMGEQMGADPAGIAMACLCVCGAAISDSIKLRVKRHADWTESARIWVSIVGAPSTKKTPILNAAARPLCAIDSSMLSDWIHARNGIMTSPRKIKRANRRRCKNAYALKMLQSRPPNLYLRAAQKAFFACKMNCQASLARWTNTVAARGHRRTVRFGSSPTMAVNMPSIGLAGELHCWKIFPFPCLVAFNRSRSGRSLRKRRTTASCSVCCRSS